MDTLAGYGSDSDSSSRNSAPLVHTKTSNGSSQNTASAKPSPESRKRARSPPAPLVLAARGTAPEDNNSSKDPTNVHQDDDGEDQRTPPPPPSVSLLRLPTPALRSDSLVHWSRDYLTPLQESVATIAGYPRVSANPLAQLEASLQSNRQDGGDGGSPPNDDDDEDDVDDHDSPITKSKSIAQQLRHDHEFCNPHQFQAAMIELNIQNSLGTTLPREVVQEWERVESLVQLELQTRCGSATH